MVDLRHRWIMQTFATIVLSFVPNSAVTRLIKAVWTPLVKKPFYAFPKYVRNGLGWFVLLSVVIVPLWF